MFGLISGDGRLKIPVDAGCQRSKEEGRCKAHVDAFGIDVMEGKGTDAILHDFFEGSSETFHVIIFNNTDLLVN